MQPEFYKSVQELKSKTDVMLRLQGLGAYGCNSVARFSSFDDML